MFLSIFRAWICYNLDTKDHVSLHLSGRNATTSAILVLTRSFMLSEKLDPLRVQPEHHLSPQLLFHEAHL